MTPLRRLGIAAAAAALALGAACHADPTEPELGPDAASRAAAAEFQQLADSLYRAGGDPMVWRGYFGLQRLVSTVGRAVPVTLRIDGVPEEYVATVQQLALDPTGCPAGAACPTLPPLRAVVAWQRSNPRRVVQLTSTSDDAPLGVPTMAGTMPRFLAGATLTYFDGTGGYYVGTGGTMSTRLTWTSEEECFPRPPYPTIDVAAPLSLTYGIPCTKAAFTVAFGGTVQPPAAGGPRDNRAAGRHEISMVAQPVSGGQILLSSRYCYECVLRGYPEYLLPPLDLRLPTLLTANLAVAVTDVVTFTFTVTNGATAPATIEFPTAQQYDFAVTNIATGGVVWRWSAGRLFAQMLGTRILAPGEKLVFTEQWTPTVKGPLLAQAQLASSSHSAYAGWQFVVP